MNAEEIMENQRWVLAFDKNIGKRIDITICDRKLVNYYKAKYEMDGYRAEVFTNEEVDIMMQESIGGVNGSLA